MTRDELLKALMDKAWNEHPYPGAVDDDWWSGYEAGLDAALDAVEHKELAARETDDKA